MSLRVFGPPEDRVRDILHGGQGSFNQQRKAAAPPAQDSSANVKVLQDKARKDAYRSELEAQIRDKAARKAAEKNALAAADAKKEAEMAAYSPWGRAGAGAPLRDADGKVENRSRAQRELQKDLDMQIQEKKRRKELEQLREAEEAQREEQQLQAEQARLTAQFESEQAKEKAKASQAADVDEAVAGAWNAAKKAAVLERNKPELQQRERQQLMLEALRLEEEKMRQLAAQEVGRLRQDMETHAAALRSVVERQGNEMATLRSAAAAAEAESVAAKNELVQVRQEFLRRSQELPHETLSTILADYGRGPVSTITAAYHPNPIHKIDLELPPSAAEIRSFGTTAAHAVSAAVDGPQPEAPSISPAAVAALGTQLPPSWLGTGLVNKSALHVRGSMLASESTFIFPAGIPASASAEATGNKAEMSATDGFNSDIGGMQHSLSASRRGLVTPGGSDLSTLVSRTADRLQLLSSMPPPGDPEALDEFLSKFVSSSSQVSKGVDSVVTEQE
eukprot:gene8174-8365_t